MITNTNEQKTLTSSYVMIFRAYKKKLITFHLHDLKIKLNKKKKNTCLKSSTGVISVTYLQYYVKFKTNITVLTYMNTTNPQFKIIKNASF